MSKSRKASKPLLRPAALSLLAQRCGEGEWRRVLDLREISVEATLDYIKAIAPPEFYQQFLEAQMSPEELAARRKAEAEKKEIEERESRTIYQSAPKVTQADLLREQGGWRAATLTEAERAEAAKQAEEERTGTRAIPKPEFDSL
jgi:hypothetical protein